MKRKLLVLSLAALLVTACVSPQTSDSSFLIKVESSETVGLVEYEYEDLNEKLIKWSDIYTIERNHFYVYFFSRTCGHCERIKNLVIPMLLNRRIYYACEASEEHQICYNPEMGHLTQIDFCIRGYPTIVEIQNWALVRYASGENEVLSFLNSK